MYTNSSSRETYRETPPETLLSTQTWRRQLIVRSAHSTEKPKSAEPWFGLPLLRPEGGYVPLDEPDVPGSWLMAPRQGEVPHLSGWQPLMGGDLTLHRTFARLAHWYAAWSPYKRDDWAFLGTRWRGHCALEFASLYGPLVSESYGPPVRRFPPGHPHPFAEPVLLYLWHSERMKALVDLWDELRVYSRNHERATLLRDHIAWALQLDPNNRFGCALRSATFPVMPESFRDDPLYPSSLKGRPFDKRDRSRPADLYDRTVYQLGHDFGIEECQAEFEMPDGELLRLWWERLLGVISDGVMRYCGVRFDASTGETAVRPFGVLGASYAHFAREVMGHRIQTLVPCPGCGKLNVPDRKGHVYCRDPVTGKTDRCRQKARYRARRSGT